MQDKHKARHTTALTNTLCGL